MRHQPGVGAFSDIVLCVPLRPHTELQIRQRPAAAPGGVGALRRRGRLDGTPVAAFAVSGWPPCASVVEDHTGTAGCSSVHWCKGGGDFWAATMAATMAASPINSTAAAVTGVSESMSRRTTLRRGFPGAAATARPTEGRALGTWVYEAYLMTASSDATWLAGYYDDEYLVEEGSWRISSMRPTYFFNSDASKDWMRAVGELGK